MKYVATSETGIEGILANNSVGCACLRACDQSPHPWEGALNTFPATTTNAYALTTLPQFGDGIMSMIDCKVNLDKKPDPKGDRVVLTFE